MWSAGWATSRRGSALGVRLRELTTYFRVFDVASLRRLPLRHISARRIQLRRRNSIHYLNKAGIELREVPIHFVDRTRGASKIPRAQVLWSALDLAQMCAKRRVPRSRISQPDHFRRRCVPELRRSRAGDEARRRSSGVAPIDCPSPDVKPIVAPRSQARSIPARLHLPALRTRAGARKCGAWARSWRRTYEGVVDARVPGNARPRGSARFASCFDTDRAPSASNPPGTLLEVGAYCGLFLAGGASSRMGTPTASNHRAGRRTYAREHVEGLHRASQATCARTIATTCGQAMTSSASWDVLEHVRDPAAVRSANAGIAAGVRVACCAFPRSTSTHGFPSDGWERAGHG